MTNMTNMYDMTNMSNIQKYANPFRIWTPLWENEHPLFYITNITNMQEICNKYEHPLFLYSKNIKYEKNAEYDIHPPGQPAAGRLGVGRKNMTNMRNMQNMQNNNFCKGMFLWLFASSIASSTSGYMCRSTQQWCRGHVRSANCIQVRPVLGFRARTIF